ncbi:MAG: phosphoribosylformylglycinamidine synthase II, partial [Epsilonproteobacteria bacterium]|nr:phosphoribosylformylglycinamidine synthase II [Campylobacterota bacterium]
EDASKVLPSHLIQEEDVIYLVGETFKEFGGSLYLKELFGKVAGELPKIDYERELKLWKFIIEGNKKGLFKAAKDVGVGGIAIALAKMCAVGDKGFLGNFCFEDSREIFSESFSRALVEIDPKKMHLVEEFANEIGILAIPLGTVGGNSFELCDIKMPLEKLKDIYFNTFAKEIEI